METRPFGGGNTCLPPIPKDSGTPNHPPFTIDGDGDLAAFPNITGGDGSSWAQARIIEDLVIDGNGSNAAACIANTTDFIVIKNCTFSNTPAWSVWSAWEPQNTNWEHNYEKADAFMKISPFEYVPSLNLINSSNVNVTNCTFRETLGDGFCIENSRDIVVNDSLSFECFVGISTYQSLNISVTGSQFRENVLICVAYGSTNQSLIADNNAVGAYYAYSLYTCKLDTVTNNTGTRANCIASIYDTNSTVITHNYFGQSISQAGIALAVGYHGETWYCVNNTVKWNTLEGNEREGLRLRHARYNEISYNNFIRNKEGCITQFSDEFSYNNIHDNECIMWFDWTEFLLLTGLMGGTAAVLIAISLHLKKKHGRATKITQKGKKM